MTTLHKNGDYSMSIESPMCHPETCNCDDHFIYKIRKHGSFVSSHETETEAKKAFDLITGEIK